MYVICINLHTLHFLGNPFAKHKGIDVMLSCNQLKGAHNEERKREKKNGRKTESSTQLTIKRNFNIIIIVMDFDVQR